MDADVAAGLVLHSRTNSTRPPSTTRAFAHSRSSGVDVTTNFAIRAHSGFEPSEQDQKNDDGCEEARNEFEALVEVAHGASIRRPTMCTPRRWGASEAGKADHGSESIVGAWPVGSDGVEAGPADDAPQHGGDDDGVVGITEDGHEVRDEINGNSEIGQQQHKPDAYSMREGFVRSQPADQAKHIGQQPQCLAQESAARPDQD